MIIVEVIMFSKATKILVVLLLIVAVAAFSEHFVGKLSAKEKVTDKASSESAEELPPCIKVGKFVGCTVISSYDKESRIMPWFSKLLIKEIKGNWVYVQNSAENTQYYWIYAPNYIWAEAK